MAKIDIKKNYSPYLFFLTVYEVYFLIWSTMFFHFSILILVFWSFLCFGPKFIFHVSVLDFEKWEWAAKKQEKRGKVNDCPLSKDKKNLFLVSMCFIWWAKFHWCVFFYHLSLWKNRLGLRNKISLWLDFVLFDQFKGVLVKILAY
jgi:hypothetical protein